MAKKDLSPAEKLAATKKTPDRGEAVTELARARRKLGLSLEDVGDAVGLSAATVRGMEDGNRVPSLLTAFQMADFYGTTVDRLFRDRVPPSSPDGVDKAVDDATPAVAAVTPEPEPTPAAEVPPRAGPA